MTATEQAAFTHLKAGDKVTRMLAGTVPMRMKVLKIDDTLIHCGAVNSGISGWTFDRATGAEVDEDLHWGPAYGITGSFLVHEGA